MIEEKSVLTSEERIQDLFEKITDFLMTECQKYNYTAAELYIAGKYFTHLLAETMGPEATKKIEKSFLIINPKDYKDVV